MFMGILHISDTPSKHHLFGHIHDIYGIKEERMTFLDFE